MGCTYIVPCLLATLLLPYMSYSPIHTHVYTLMALAATHRHSQNRKRFAVQYLAWGHFNMLTGGARDHLTSG